MPTSTGHQAQQHDPRGLDCRDCSHPDLVAFWQIRTWTSDCKTHLVNKLQTLQCHLPALNSERHKRWKGGSSGGGACHYQQVEIKAHLPSPTAVPPQRHSVPAWGAGKATRKCLRSGVHNSWCNTNVGSSSANENENKKCFKTTKNLKTRQSTNQHYLERLWHLCSTSFLDPVGCKACEKEDVKSIWHNLRQKVDR